MDSERRVILGPPTLHLRHIQNRLFCLFPWREEGLISTNVYLSLWLQQEAKEVQWWGGVGRGMFYACLNMHLKSKSIRNDSENAKGFHQCLLIHDALRKATYFRANSCYHRRSSTTEVIFHLRTCTLMTVWGAGAGMDTHNSMLTTHAISKWRGRWEFSIWNLCRLSLRILLYKSSCQDEHAHLNIIPHTIPAFVMHMCSHFFLILVTFFYKIALVFNKTMQMHSWVMSSAITHAETDRHRSTDTLQ